MKREPVLILVIIAVLTEAGGAVTALASNHTTEGVLVAVGAFLTGLGGALVRSLVTPVQAPQAPTGVVERAKW